MQTFPRPVRLLLASLLFSAPLGAQVLRTELVAEGFSRPILLTAPPGDPNRLFVVEQNSALIKIIKNGVTLSTPFLDLGSKASSGGERGLLGLAFHPDYFSNGRFFVNFTNNSGDTKVHEYAVSTDPDKALQAKVAVIQLVSQPFSNHNGGCLAFGADGMLYIGMGDGGSANDPGNRAQDLSERLGKILRLDVDIPPPYIPADNPFVGKSGVREEIWAYGIRNPWRFSFDSLTGDLYIGDVGQNAWEEINFQPAGSAGGENYGWRCMEGNNCTNLSGCVCGSAALTQPIHEYGHNLGCSITGGHVYRGPINALSGTYFFGDYCSARIWSFRYDGSTMTEFKNRTNELDPPGSDVINDISSFGEDGLGNLYIVDHADGQIFRITSDCDVSNYCGTTPNSVGPGAVMGYSGSLSLTDNSFGLTSSGGVPGQFGYFIFGDQAVSVPTADGVRCVGGKIFRLLPPQIIDGSGNVFNGLDFNTPPFNGAGQVFAGTTYYFQHWYRDKTGGPAGSNFSDGLQAIFCL
jgi:glucose/arabinose dehydrogenase